VLGVDGRTVSDYFRSGRQLRSATLGSVATGLTQIAHSRGIAEEVTLADLLGLDPQARHPDPGAETDTAGLQLQPQNVPTIPMRPDLAETFRTGQGHLAMPPFNPEEVVMVPLYGECPCGEPVVIDDSAPREHYPFHPTALPRGCHGGNCIILRAIGESMAPRILPGSLLIVRLDVEPEVGKPVLANVRGNGCTVKWLARGPAGLELRPENPADPSIPVDHEDTRIIGVVVDWWTRGTQAGR